MLCTFYLRKKGRVHKGFVNMYTNPSPLRGLGFFDFPFRGKQNKEMRAIRRLGSLMVILMVLVVFSGCLGGVDSKIPDQGKSESDLISTKGHEVADGQPVKSLADGLEDKPETQGKSQAEADPVSQDADYSPESVTTRERVSEQVTLLVTTDFGKKKIADSTVSLPKGATVMEIMQEHFDLKTSYGGGFVESIDGLKSGYSDGLGGKRQKMDWFYSVNGVQGNVGSGEYLSKDGDFIWWDYHDWNQAMFVPAVTGCYPEPFLNGYENKTTGTLIMHSTGLEVEAEVIKSNLADRGVKNISLEALDTSKVLTRGQPTVIVGRWEQLGEDKNIQKIMANKSKTGIFMDLSVGEFVTLNAKREKVGSYTEQVGAVLATGNGSGDPSPLWIITGIDDAGLKQAIDLLGANSAKLAGTFSVLITDGEAINLPID